MMENSKEIIIEPLDFNQFKEKYGDEVLGKEELLQSLKNEIDELANFAIAPYFWFVSSKEMQVLDSSDNIHQLTPFGKNEWQKHYPNFLQHIIPEEDFNYFFGASAFMVEYLEKATKEEKNHLKFSIYCRMQDKNKKLRWVVFQFPKIIYDEFGKSLCGFVCITDLGAFEIVNQPRMTIMNTKNKKNPYYLAVVDQKRIENLNIPHISKREREILVCIINGLKTPEIAEKLFISYHTVENHKRNLRAKTHCKTSGELVNFVLQNQLM